MNDTDQGRTVLELDQDSQRFMLWCLESLGLQATRDPSGTYTIERGADNTRPEPVGPLSEAWAESPVLGRQFVLHRSTDAEGTTPNPVELLTVDSPLGNWIREQVRPPQRVLHAAPTDQPVSIHELASALFTPYQVDDGHMHLTGCRLEDRPFLRLSYRAPTTLASGRIVDCFAASDGSLLEDAACRELQLVCLVPLTGRTPYLEDAVVRQWIEVAHRACLRRGGDSTAMPLAATIVWCKYATGKLSFTIRGAAAELDFSGWARLIRERVAVPPPFTCPWTGEQSYHLAATDAGKITVATAIAKCAKSERRVLKSELEQCAESGCWVLPEYLWTCPVTGVRVLPEYMTTCAMCGQEICTSAVAHGICAACRRLHTVTRDDPVLARVLGTYPNLDGGRNWKIAETQAVYILVGTRLWKRRLVVLAKETLEPLRVATAGRLSRHWTDATEAQRAAWL